MYICICAQVTEDDLNKVLKGTEKTSDELLKKLNKQHCCRTCEQAILTMIEEKRKTTAP